MEMKLWFDNWMVVEKIGVAGKSGHHGHAGRPGRRGGSAAIPLIGDYVREYDDRGGLVRAIVRDEFPTFDEVRTRIGNDVYDIIAEEWFDDCMESRGMGETNEDSIETGYLDLMQTEARWPRAPDIHGYVHNARYTEYGVTYIGRKVGNAKRPK